MPSSISSDVYDQRVVAVNDRALRSDGEYILYWMTANRRAHSNFALQRARDWARELKKPLLVLEALRVRYRWASERLHQFIIGGMYDNGLEFQQTVAHYYPYVEPWPGHGNGLVETLAKSACVVVTDDYPCFFYPQLIRVAAKAIAVKLEAVDSHCLIPMRAWDRTFTVAHSYRRAMQKVIPTYLDRSPEANPLLARSVSGIPRFPKILECYRRWPRASFVELFGDSGLAKLDINHEISVTSLFGGSEAARRSLKNFMQRLLGRYDEDRNHPDLSATSELSPYLHFGHVSAHEVFWALMRQVQWTPDKLSKPNGSIEGFWNVGAAAEAFLDQLCTWREIGFNMCHREPNYDRYESLPDWAQKTLADHESDPRPHLYSYEELEQGRTYDPLWNAAQNQLVCDGRIHNYLRMLWGKRFLEWTPNARVALEWMIELNNKYALDGRDPNSYSGIFWVLGRYDRAWGPERPIYGKIRYMSSENTARKVRVKEYQQRFRSQTSSAG